MVAMLDPKELKPFVLLRRNSFSRMSAQGRAGAKLIVSE